jgi:hypothetical protein
MSTNQTILETLDLLAVVAVVAVVVILELPIPEILVRVVLVQPEPEREQVRMEVLEAEPLSMILFPKLAWKPEREFPVWIIIQLVEQ